MSRSSLMNSIKASKIQLTLSGVYPNLRTDIRKLYYAISEIQIKARFDLFPSFVNLFFAHKIKIINKM